MVRYDSSRLDGSLTFSVGVFARIGGTTLARKASSTSMRLLRNTFSNTLTSTAAVASLPAPSRAKTRTGAFRSWSWSSAKKPTLRPASAPVTPADRCRVAVIAHVADADARFDVGRRDAIDDHLRAAVVHEVVDREHRDLRRRQPDLDAARHFGRHLAPAEQHLARAGGDEPRRARLERRQRLLAHRPLQDQRAVGLLDQLGLRVAGQREHRRPGAVLLERDRQRLERRAVRIDPQLEVAVLADERPGLGEGEGRARLADRP